MEDVSERSQVIVSARRTNTPGKARVLPTTKFWKLFLLERQKANQNACANACGEATHVIIIASALARFGAVLRRTRPETGVPSHSNHHGPGLASFTVHMSLVTLLDVNHHSTPIILSKPLLLRRILEFSPAVAHLKETTTAPTPTKLPFDHEHCSRAVSSLKTPSDT